MVCCLIFERFGAFWLMLYLDFGGVAQLGEHLLCKQGVIGSIPFTSISGLRVGMAYWLRLRAGEKLVWGYKNTVFERISLC